MTQPATRTTPHPDPDTQAGSEDPATEEAASGPGDAGAGSPYRRINDVAAEVGLTARAIRYYEEQGLLAPAARSEGAYRLFDESDVDRLRFIRALRDDAGFSLAQIRQLLEDDAVRERNRIRFRASHDPGERRAIVLDALERVDRQIATLGEKANRIAEMIAEAEERRAHLRTRLRELEAGQ